MQLLLCRIDGCAKQANVLSIPNTSCSTTGKHYGGSNRGTRLENRPARLSARAAGFMAAQVPRCLPKDEV